MTWEIFLLLGLLGIKHFLADFVFQYDYMVREKGIYGAGGGIQHAMAHGIGTFVVLMLVMSHSPWILPLSFADSIVHYHIDWVKQQVNRNLTYSDRMWWVWLGADQAAHYLTYIAIIAIITQ